LMMMTLKHLMKQVSSPTLDLWLFTQFAIPVCYHSKNSTTLFYSSHGKNSHQACSFNLSLYSILSIMLDFQFAKLNFPLPITWWYKHVHKPC
jgi:hypothetical protein